MTTTRETKGFDFTNIIVYSSAILGAIVGGFVVWLFFTVFRGGNFPFVTTERSAFIALAILGTTMCALVFPIRASLSKKFKWLSPFTISAIFLGSLIVLFVILHLTNVLNSIIPNERTAIIILTFIILLKWISATASLFLQKE
ncbi:MAG: hypothetical protein HeimAB125_01270 [Candidatus Heimdallarchaeota archaeon AB_125]|nr:MAG: hypothetical protein HeimAB125_01270 [Candidatus Heimdallarchaeota archaeon AB_125]